MANVLKGEIPIELCGKKYTLHLDFEGMLEAEDRMGKPLPVVFQSWATRPPSLREMASVIYGGLLSDKDVKGRHLTFEEVGKRILETGFFNLHVPVVQLVRNALVPARDEEEPAKKKDESEARSSPKPLLGEST